ncbi:hypothetical protein Golob_024050 [Gossypium lobatum]|uniref:DUF4283 domain-containing protein n=1 Tax=Gossypium lobatum TaxID=34289 RepID=A0A7J8NG36_9ROSI|nr:hypothetical protein [Gossypium lobatum]
MDHEICDEGNLANRSTKKVCIRATEGVLDVIMDPIRATGKPLSWKDRPLGTRLRAYVRTKTMNNVDGKDDFELSETDIVRSSINGIPSIRFFEQVNKLLIKDVVCTLVIKLLERSIEYSALYNKDFEKVLSPGPWIVYGKYLTVQPWIEDFSTSQHYPSTVMAWIRLRGLLGHMYKRRILWEIGGMIGKVTKGWFG